MNYQKINVVVGWVMFGVAMTVYGLTVEPTASFWDCGEFIATSYKLEVPHPPGAPFFLLTGRLFSLLANDVDQVAYWVNMLSALSAALTILFLFWSITHLARKILGTEKGNETTGQTMAIMGAGIVGALACTFSDSFWFSAVEAEVYAMSSFFTAFVFWAILKWETLEDEAYKLRFLILIAYMMGLSIGVHLLNLVTIPALGLIVYFNYTSKITRNGVLATLAISGGLILIIMIGLIPGMASMVGSMEVFFVNGIGLPFGSGVVAFALLFVGSLVFGLYYSVKHKKVILNTILLGFAFILIGYSSYTIVLIRSGYDTPIDENNPEDIMTYVSYLKREQYGSRPLFKGQYYTAEIIDQVKGEPVYMKGEDKYIVKDYKVDYVYDPKHTTILPRMYSKSPDGSHQQRYMQVTGLKNGEKPSFSDNLKFMFVHQLGTMYLRYFMWNFSGRESDIQDASWVSLPDSFKKLPEEFANNKGRNIYYGLPLFLGLFGMFFQYRKNATYFWVTLLLFFLTGAALVLYLNSPPIEPRERDYIYAGSYYVFTIWMGLAVLAVFEALAQALKNQKVAALLAFLVLVPVPALMAKENWDDHDRSHRYFSIEAAKNYLDSCAPNSILFTGGDNDTFPLWFAQEVLGHRTDVRVIVLSYFNTDWYIEQMMRDAYESKALPFSLTLSHYQQGGLNDYLPYIETQGVSGAINLKQYLNLIRQEHPGLRVPTSISAYNRLPAKDIYLNVELSNQSEIGFYTDSLNNKLAQKLTDRLFFKLKGSGLEKKDLAILDLIATGNFERPIYFNNTSLNSINFDVNQHIIQEGLTYRLVPVLAGNQERLVNTEVMYDNLMNRFHWKELNNPEVYYSEDYRSFCFNHRSVFNTLAEQLMQEGDMERAKNVMKRSLEVMPDITIPYDIFSVYQVSLLLRAGEKELAEDIAVKVSKRAVDYLDYITSKGEELGDSMDRQRRIMSLNELARAYRASGEKDKAAEYEGLFSKYYSMIR